MLNSMVFEDDMNIPASFCEADLRAIRNPKWRANVERYLSKIPQKINLIIRNQTETTHWRLLRAAIMDSENTPLTPDMLNVKPDPEAITIVLGGNRELKEGKSVVNPDAFTPWIVVHRMFHAMDFGHMKPTRGVGKPLYNYFGAEGSLNYRFNTAYKTIVSSIPRTYENYGIRSVEYSKDFYTELATKYLINRGLRDLSGLDTVDRDPKTGWPIRENLEEAYETFQRSIDDLLVECIGKVLYF